jgi:hypothetical protein
MLCLTGLRPLLSIVIMHLVCIQVHASNVLKGFAGLSISPLQFSPAGSYTRTGVMAQTNSILATLFLQTENFQAVPFDLLRHFAGFHS